MKVATAGQMKSIDRRAIQGMGIPGLELMEHAGRGVVWVTERILGPVAGKRVVAVCGRGNNGGDGFVAARILKEKGAEASVLLLCEGGALTGDAAGNRRRALEVGVPVREILDSGTLGAAGDVLSAAEVVIDGVLGTGITGEVRGIAREAIAAINRSAGRVVAVDAPSGLDADNGGILGSCVEATATVTFGLPKRGHFLMPGRARVGRLAVADIGLPAGAVEEENIRVECLENRAARDLLPARAPDAHKWSCGHLVLVAGSTGMTGAAALASEAALRAGAGLTTLCTPKSLNPIFEIKLTETMTRPMPETVEGSLAQAAESPVLELARTASAVVIGPGVSQVGETSGLVRSLVSKLDAPLVIDADGLNAFAGGNGFKHAAGVLPVVTPHLGELSRLVGVEKDEISRDRIEAAIHFAGELDAVLLLKGFPTIVAHPSGDVSINLTGSCALATAGSGDVLTGTIGGLLAQGLDPYAAARLGAMIHGAAGDLASEAYGFRSVMAGDVLDLLPQAILDLESASEEDDSLRWLF